MQYSNAVRAQVKEENPTLPVTEIAKVIGAKWKALSTAEKEPYVKLAADDKVRYDREMELYKAGKTGGDADEGEEEAVDEENDDNNENDD